MGGGRWWLCALVASSLVAFGGSETDTCACGDGNSHVSDADCLDTLLCDECQPCATRCCLGTQMWAPFTSARPWSLRSEYGVVSTRLASGKYVVLVMGGRLETDANATEETRLNDVWESGDGREWEQRNFSRVWSARQGFGAASHEGSIYVAGGVDAGGVLLSDVWSWNRSAWNATSPGAHTRVAWPAPDPVREPWQGLPSWVLHTQDAPWGGRMALSLLVLPSFESSGNASEGLNQTSLFVIGGVGTETRGVRQGVGGNGSVVERTKVPVWVAGAGGGVGGWRLVAEDVGGDAVSGFGAVSHYPEGRLPRMMLIGGRTSHGSTVGQVLSSSDGAVWVNEVDYASMALLVSREHAAVASDGLQVVLAGGVRNLGEPSPEMLLRDVAVSFYHCHETGCSNAGREWTPGTRSAQWQERAGSHLVSMGDSMLLVGGWVYEFPGDHSIRRHLGEVYVTQQRCHKGHVGPACSPCPPGTFSETQVSLTEASCDPCHVGHEAPLEGSSKCTKCEAGHYAPDKGYAACLPCPPGSRQEAPGSGKCALCDAGTHQSFEGKTECDECPARYYCVQGTAEPVGCPLGSFADFGQGKRLQDCQCLEGFFSPNGTAPCSACPQGTYQPGQAASSCIECEAGTTTSSDASIYATECKPVEPPSPSSTPQMTSFDFHIGIISPLESVNASISAYIQAIAATAQVGVAQIRVTLLQRKTSINGDFTDAGFSILLDMRSLQEISVNFQITALNAELSALSLPRAYALNQDQLPLPTPPPPPPPPPSTTPAVSPAVNPTPGPTPSQAPAATPPADIVSSSPKPNQEPDMGQMEAAGAAGAIVAAVFGCLAWCIFRIRRSLQSGRRAADDQGPPAQSPGGKRAHTRRIEMRQLPLVFNKKSKGHAHHEGYERTALVSASADEDDETTSNLPMMGDPGQ